MEKEENEIISKTFVLVHGAWLAPYAWSSVNEKLLKTGQQVIVIELPGHGADATPPQSLSLDTYRDHIIKEISGVEGKVILVGHSLAGVIISVVAEAVPEKIEKLIYVGAYVPANGQSVLDLASTDAKSLLGAAIVPSEDQLTLDVKHEAIIAIFCVDAAPSVQQSLLKNYKPEPAIPFTIKAELSNGNFGNSEKIYVHTMQDRAISPELQKQMVAVGSIQRTYELDSSHTPFLSMPEKLTDLLLHIAQ